MATLKVKELLPGSYTVTAFESIESSYRQSYKIYATSESTEEVTFYSNLYLTTYINKMKLRCEFKIIIDDSHRITIPGYSTIIKLAARTKL